MSPAVADMEEVKSSQLDDGAAMEIRFSDLCNKLELDLDESSMAQAIVLFKESKHILLANMSAIGTGSPEEIERLWSAFVLYFVAGLNQGAAKQEEEGGVIISRILRAFKLNASDFFKELPQFSLKTGPVLNRLYGADWERRLGVKELKANIDQLVLLTRYYKRAYREFFLPCDTSTSQCSAVSNSAEYVSDYYRFGWLLFLALRKHAFSPFKDLVTCAKGLVSILVISILHIPMQFRNFNIQNSPLFAKKSDQGINLLASLSGIYQTTEDELRRTTEQVNNLIVELLKRKPCPASNCKSKNLDYINPDGLTYFEDLLEENFLHASLLQLEKDFGNGISIESDLDERILVNDGNCFLGAESLSGGVITISGTKRKFDLFAPPSKAITSPLSPQSSPATPRNGNLVSNSKMPVSTPVSTAMTTAKWLRDVISLLPSKPSAELERFLSSCDRDVTSNVTRRANIILEAIFPTNYFGESCVSGNRGTMGLMDSTWAEQRKMEALKLYYRVLEAICRAESHILNGSNLTSLLSNEQFHRCMLACSAELVLATYKTIIMTFPAVLEKAGITAFDLSKVIESFVRHEETLPRELKRYLNSLEERLLESLVWEKGSSMYNFLIVARPALSAEINRLGLLAEPLPSLDAIAMHHNIYSGGLPPLSFQKHEHSPGQNGDPRSPKRRCGEYRSVLVERNSFASPIKERLLTFNSPKSKTPPLQSAFASPTRPNPAGGETCAEAGINIFLSKITKLAAIRIRSLCERLGLSQQIQERIYYLIQKILSQRTALFFERHIDQIILCSFYGVAKISQLNLTFKEIIHNYRKQPQCKPLVFRSILVNWPSTSHNGKIGQEHVDIITFYNGIFIPSVKPLLMELDPSEGSQKETRGPEDKNNAGQIPGSPQLSSFPNLPDMSPKKVSASHNVFVSPLQPSKMDSLLSPSSKSYYACIGESTHAYQSPSKDLTAINDYLNCGRKVNGRLNFDVVSDSVVARSLYNQNGSSASSTATFNLPPPVKLEQPNP